jgi:hypothetical protein
MPTDQIDDESGAPPQPRKGIRVVRIAAARFAAILTIVNIIAFWMFSHQRAGGVGLVLANLALMFLGVVCARNVERDSGGASLATYALVVFGAPFVAAGIEIGIIEALGWGGC